LLKLNYKYSNDKKSDPMIVCYEAIQGTKDDYREIGRTESFK